MAEIELFRWEKYIDFQIRLPEVHFRALATEPTTI